MSTITGNRTPIMGPDNIRFIKPGARLCVHRAGMSGVEWYDVTGVTEDNHVVLQRTSDNTTHVLCPASMLGPGARIYLML